MNPLLHTIFGDLSYDLYSYQHLTYYSQRIQSTCINTYMAPFKAIAIETITNMFNISLEQIIDMIRHNSIHFKIDTLNNTLLTNPPPRLFQSLDNKIHDMVHTRYASHVRNNLRERE